MSDRETTADLLARLRRHYIKPGQALAGGVFIAETGWNGGIHTTRADALYVGFTGTSGRLLIGHEVKASRADWLHELDQHGKADAWADQCHAWYVVAPSTDIVKPEELPPDWGLMLPGRSRTRMTVARPATIHRDRTPSWDACRSLLARLDTLQAQRLAEIREEARREVTERTNKEVAEVREQWAERSGDSHAVRELAQIRDVIQLEIKNWGDRSITPKELNAAVSRYLAADRDLQRAAHDLLNTWQPPIETLRHRLNRMSAALDELAKIAESVGA